MALRSKVVNEVSKGSVISHAIQPLSVGIAYLVD